MPRRHLDYFTPTADGPLRAKLDEHDDALDAQEALGSTVLPGKTAAVASATTVTLPETGLLVPITGTTQVDFITKPTGDAPRLALLWFQSACTVRHNVAGAGAGATNIQLIPGGNTNLGHAFAANSLCWLMFDGTVWRQAGSYPHWNGSQVMGSSASALLTLNSAVGSRLEFTSATRLDLDGTRATLLSPNTRLDSKLRFTAGSVASASNVTFPANCCTITITGTTTVNTFNPTGFEVGQVYLLRFDGILTLTHNSGGANDFVSRSGANITTAAGMSLWFYYDGTDLVETGR